MRVQGPLVGPCVRRRAGAGTDVATPLPGIDAPLERLIRIGRYPVRVRVGLVERPSSAGQVPLPKQCMLAWRSAARTPVVRHPVCVLGISRAIRRLTERTTNDQQHRPRASRRGRGGHAVRKSHQRQVGQRHHHQRPDGSRRSRTRAGRWSRDEVRQPARRRQARRRRRVLHAAAVIRHPHQRSSPRTVSCRSSSSPRPIPSSTWRSGSRPLTSGTGSSWGSATAASRDRFKGWRTTCRRRCGSAMRPRAPIPVTRKRAAHGRSAIPRR